MSQIPQLKEVLELFEKVRNRASRMSESTQNPSQTTIDALYNDSLDAYYNLKECIENLESPKPPSTQSYLDDKIGTDPSV